MGSAASAAVVCMIHLALFFQGAFGKITTGGETRLTPLSSGKPVAVPGVARVRSRASQVARQQSLAHLDLGLILLPA